MSQTVSSYVQTWSKIEGRHPLLLVAARGFSRVRLEELLLVTPSLLLIGVGFFKQRRWARLPALILCAPAVFSFPFGTGLAIYTWWFLHGAGGRRMFGKN